MHWLAIALGGAIGATLRYAVAGWVQASRWVPASFPSGTMVVNVSGSFAIGVLTALFYGRFVVAPATRTFLLVGVLGGYTTFSTFGLETFTLIEEGSLGLAAVNAFGSVLLGLMGVAAGLALGRWL